MHKYLLANITKMYTDKSIEDYLNRFARFVHDFSRYGIVMEDGPGSSCNVWDLDLLGKDNVLLVAGDKYLAVCGIVYPEDGIGVINQIKGIGGMFPWLYPVKWQPALVSFVADTLQENGFDEARIVSFRQYKNVQDEDRGYIPRQRAFRNLDLAAQQCGFVPVPDKKMPQYWKKLLNDFC